MSARKQNYDEQAPFLTQDDDGAKLVYDAELDGYFRKDAIARLKNDPHFLNIIKESNEITEEDLESTEQDSKDLSRKSNLMKSQSKLQKMREKNSSKVSVGENENAEQFEDIDYSEGDVLDLPFEVETEKTRPVPIGEKRTSKKEDHLSLSDTDDDDLFKDLKIETFKDPLNKIDNVNQFTRDETPLGKEPVPKKRNKGKDIDDTGFIKKIDAATYNKVERIVQSQKKDKLANLKQTAPALYMEFNNEKDVSTFIDKQPLEHFTKTLTRLSPTSIIKLLADPTFIDRNPSLNSAKMVTLFTYMRRHSIIKNYDRQDIREHLERIISNLHQLSPQVVATLTFNLDKMRINEPEYFRQLETFIIAHAAKFDLRCLSNIVFSFANISRRQSIVNDFSNLYQSLQVPISLRLKEKQPKDLSQIMAGYSKTQNFSNEFLYVMEKACIDVLERFNGQEITTILQSFWKNEYNSDHLLNFAKNKLLNEPQKFKIMEISLISEVLSDCNLFDEKLHELVEKQFLLKNENTNAQDAAILYKVLLDSRFKPKEETLSKFVQIFEFLFENIDGNCLRKMTEGYAEKYQVGNTSVELDNILARKFKSLTKINKLKGINYEKVVKEIARSENNKLKFKIKHTQSRLTKSLSKIPIPITANPDESEDSSSERASEELP